VTDAPEPPSSVRPAVSPALEAVCLRALRKDPSERFAFAREMRAELRAALGRRSHGVIPSDDGSVPEIGAAPTLEASSLRAHLEPPPRGGSRLVAAVAVLSLAAGAALVVGASGVSAGDASPVLSAATAPSAPPRATEPSHAASSHATSSSPSPRNAVATARPADSGTDARDAAAPLPALYATDASSSTARPAHEDASLTEVDAPGVPPVPPGAGVPGVAPGLGPVEADAGDRDPDVP
jgi:hypothetical protein